MVKRQLVRLERRMGMFTVSIRTFLFQRHANTWLNWKRSLLEALWWKASVLSVIDPGVPLPSTADPGNYQTMDYRSGDFTRCLMVSTRAALTQEQIFALFDLIPGMEYCELQRDAYGMSKGEWLITKYRFTHQSASLILISYFKGEEIVSMTCCFPSVTRPKCQFWF